MSEPVCQGADRAASEAMAERVLGPLFHRFCYKLWLNQMYWPKDATAVLFAARGGLRLRHFYDIFLARHGLEAPLPMADLLVSRMAAFKLAYLDHPHVIAGYLAKEYAACTVREAVASFLPGPVFDRWWAAQRGPQFRALLARRRAVRDDFLGVIAKGTNGADVVRGYLGEQRRLGRAHLEEASGGRAKILLVDTGWRGSILGGLRLAFPDVELTGHFFGRYNYRRPAPPSWFPHLIGVEAEGPHFRWRHPPSAVFEHRHVIEGTCEVQWPSVEGYRIDNGSNRVVGQAGPFPEALRAPSAGEPLACGVVAYLRSADRELSPWAVHARAVAAAKELRRLVCFPTAREALAFTVATRSADFGKDIESPVLLPPLSGFAPVARYRNVEQSLWRPGQIAVEAPALAPLFQLVYLVTRRLSFRRRPTNGVPLTMQ